mgnify:CR=1 FL=1
MNLAEQNLQDIQKKISTIIDKLTALNTSECIAYSTNKVETAQELSNKLSDLYTAFRHQEKVLTDTFKSEIKSQLDALGKRYLFKEYRATNVMYRNGTRIAIYSPYYLFKGNNHGKGKGIKPGLQLLGIHHSVSNELSTYIAMLCAALSSYDEVKTLLAKEGVRLSIELIVKISKKISKLSRMYQSAEKYSMGFNNKNTVVISVDGGRVRIRNKKRGRKTAKKRNRFKGQWREVKLFVIYVVDEEGNKIKKELPIIDGMIGSPKAMFNLLKKYLLGLNLSEINNLVFVADGAPWIWKRINELLDSIEGTEQMNVYHVLDYYHAMEHLNVLAKQLYKNKREKNKWIKACKELLHAGKINEFIEKLKLDTKHKRGKIVKTERGYFINNMERLIYKTCKDNGFPQGSGAIESSVRRVVNLRMKGNSIFWNEESANDMLLIRSFYKAGRWREIEKMSYEGGLQAAA